MSSSEFARIHLALSSLIHTYSCNMSPGSQTALRSKLNSISGYWTNAKERLLGRRQHYV